MLRFILLTCLTAFVVTAPVSAQQVEDASATGIEIGTLFGLSHFSNGSGTTALGVPTGPGGAGNLGYPALYVSWFPSEQLAIGSEFSFGTVSYDGSSQTTLYLGGRGAFFLQSNAMSAPYVLGNVALARGSDEYDSESTFSAGAGLGYQWRVGPAFVLKAEGRYRRWIDDEVNDFSLTLGLGTRLGGR